MYAANCQNVKKKRKCSNIKVTTFLTQLGILVFRKCQLNRIKLYIFRGLCSVLKCYYIILLNMKYCAFVSISGSRKVNAGLSQNKQQTMNSLFTLMKEHVTHRQAPWCVFNCVGHSGALWPRGRRCIRLLIDWVLSWHLLTTIMFDTCSLIF